MDTERISEPVVGMWFHSADEVAEHGWDYPCRITKVTGGQVHPVSLPNERLVGQVGTIIEVNRLGNCLVKGNTWLWWFDTKSLANKQQLIKEFKRLYEIQTGG